MFKSDEEYHLFVAVGFSPVYMHFASSNYTVYGLPTTTLMAGNISISATRLVYRRRYGVIVGPYQRDQSYTHYLISVGS